LKNIWDTFSLTNKRYYTELGIVLGASLEFFWSSLLGQLGAIFGYILGLIIGSGIGGAIGRSMDTKARTAGRDLIKKT
jgi:hypothetical protein